MLAVPGQGAHLAAVGGRHWLLGQRFLRALGPSAGRGARGAGAGGSAVSLALPDFGASSVFQLDAFFIRAATGPHKLGEGEPLIRRGKVPLSTTSASPITLSNTPTSPRVSGYVREQSSHPNGWGPA